MGIRGPLRSRVIVGLGALAFLFMWILDGEPTITRIPLVICATLLTQFLAYAVNVRVLLGPTKEAP